MMHLFLDTETTSKADMRAPIDAPHQPHIVQLAAILMDDDVRAAAKIFFWLRNTKPTQQEIDEHARTSD